MKKHLLFVALAGVALAGCVKNQIETLQDKDVKIGFATPVLYQNVGTKANVYGEIGSHKYDGTETVYTYPREEDFMIFAVEHNGDLSSWDSANKAEFNGKSISYNLSLDAWVPLKDGGTYYYWPDGEKMSFAAMSPADAGTYGSNIHYAADGLTIDEFTISDSPATQVDLLYSERSVNMTSTNMVDGADYYSGIPITFKHALSSIHFSLKTDVTETVTLKSITLKNVKNKGRFEENYNESNPVSRDPKWTADASSATRDYVSFNGEVNFPLNPQYVSALAAADGTTDDDQSHPLLMMPQELTDEVVVEIKYIVGGETKTRNVQLNNYPNDNPIEQWEVGTKYTYRLVYSKNAQIQDIIYFSPGSENWADGGIIEVIL